MAVHMPLLLPFFPSAFHRRKGSVYCLAHYAILFVKIARLRDHVLFSVYVVLGYGLAQLTLGVRNRRRSVQMTAIEKVTVVYFSV
jgi:D-alanyl-lipoteichoic acid acyltransferase DltB (MBOAT superfamily)